MLSVSGPPPDHLSGQQFPIMNDLQKWFFPLLTADDDGDHEEIIFYACVK